MIILALSVLMFGCGKSGQSETVVTPAPIVIEEPVEFTVLQRSTTPLPGSGGKILLTLDDITRGQVMTNLSWDNSTVIVATRSLRQNDVVTFTVSNYVYKIKLKTLTNVLIGEDSAEFRLGAASAETDNMMSDSEKIETLISSLKQLTGAKFIRNGKEYTVDDAISHMRSKWKWKQSEIQTVQDFIRIAGSKSSTSGEFYIIRMPDGSEVRTEDWLKEQLESLEE